MRFTNVWHDDTHVHVVEAVDATRRRLHSFPAEWSGFLRCSNSTAARVARMREAVRVVQVGDYHRFECRTESDRRELVERLRGVLGKDTLRECDVDSARRWITDNDVELFDGIRCLLVDVQCQEPGKNAEAQRKGDARVLGVSARDMLSGQEVYGNILASWDDESERDLLLGFWRACESWDVLVSWNADNHVRPMLVNRSAQLGITVHDILDSSKFAGDAWNRWAWLDQHAVDRKSRAATANGDIKASDRLDDVVFYRTGETRSPLPTEGRRSAFYECWVCDKSQLLQHLSRGSYLAYLNEHVTGYVSASLAAMRLCHCPPTTINLGPVRQADGLVLRESRSHAYRWPTVWGYGKRGKWRGAYVMQPEVVGVIDDVQVLDFASYYPRIAISGHMSPENREDPTLGNACRLPGRDGAFRRDRTGIFPAVIQKLLDARAKYQREMSRHRPGIREYTSARALSDAAKIVANSIAFGVTGTPASRFCDQQMFEGITTTGAWLIRRVIGEIRACGISVIGGDSDSIFVHDAAVDDGALKEVCEHVNGQFPSWMAKYGWVKRDNVLSLEFDEAYARMVVSGCVKGGEMQAIKKRYFGRLRMVKGMAPDPRTPHKVRGWAYRKGSSLRLARQMEEEFFDLFLGRPGSKMPSRDSLVPEVFVGWVSRWQTRVTDGHFSLDDVVKSVALRHPATSYIGKQLDENTPSHIRIAVERARRGDVLAAGDRVQCTYIMSEDGEGRKMVDAARVESHQLIDRATVWATIYTPIWQQLVAAFPGHEWPTVSDVEIRRTQHRQLLPDVISEKVVITETDGREIDVYVDEQDILLLEEIVQASPGRDRLILRFRIDDITVRATTNVRWNARLARSNNSQLRQCGASSYRFVR